MDEEIRQITERLALVEKKVRRYRVALMVMSLFVVAGVVGPSIADATKTPGIVTAKAFEVVDSSGHLLAALSPTPSAQVALSIYGKAGTLGASLGATAEGRSFLNLYAPGTERGVGLETDNKSAMIFIAGNAGKPRATLSLVGHDETALVLSDRAGRDRAVLGNEDLKNQVTDSTEHRPLSSLVLFNQKGRVVWKAP